MLATVAVIALARSEAIKAATLPTSASVGSRPFSAALAGRAEKRAVSYWDCF
jgi:hypothetical protein